MVVCPIMCRATTILALLLTLAACDEQSAPCAADDAAASSSGGSDSGASTGAVEPPEAECVFALGQCWCDGDLTALVPGSDRTCMCGDAVAPTDTCQPTYTCRLRVLTNGEHHCDCGDIEGAPRVSLDDGLCYCGIYPVAPIASDPVSGASCECGVSNFIGDTLCNEWNGAACLDPAGVPVPPTFTDGICSCGMTVLKQEHCTG